MDISEVSAAGILLEAFIIHRPKLIQIACRVLRCPYLAEDVVQDATLKATTLTGVRCVDSPLSFACQVVRHLAIDRERRRTLECSRAAPEVLAETIEASGADATAHLNLVETMRVIAAALGQLPERARLVFERHRLHDVLQRMIAAEFGVSPTLVNFMIRDAD
ncbi:MAG: sigma-70 family RNA polymerase sigma factor [Geminicoccaceae bacterium]